jgi:colicin import membrane protein
VSKSLNVGFVSKVSLTKALLFSVVLHGLLLLGLLLGDFSSLPKPSPASNQVVNPIKAVVVDKAKYEQAINKIKQQKTAQQNAEIKRIKTAEKRALQAKKRRTKEEARIKKLEAQRKKKEQEKIIADKAAQSAKTKAAEAEKVRQQKEQEKQVAEEAAALARSKRVKAEAAAKEAEAIRLEKIAEQKRQDIAKKEQAIQDAMLAEQMADEMASRNQARQQQVMSEIDRYSALITQSINQRMIKDKSTMLDKSCRLTITLVPSGFVVDVNVNKGDKVVCDAATIAIKKVNTLPVSKDPEVFKEMRTIAVNVIPQF